MSCIRCLIGHHNSCLDHDGTECCDNGEVRLEIMDSNEADDRADELEDSDVSESGGRGYSSDATLKDQQSTGRKRAAKLYPLDRTASCEWRGLKFAGGGVNPIVGCTEQDGYLQSHRHHGPDKNTLNNDKGNVHRICTFCHNRWHARNDNAYVPGAIQHPHDPDTKATPLDLLAVVMEPPVAHTHDDDMDDE